MPSEAAFATRSEPSWTDVAGSAGDSDYVVVGVAVDELIALLRPIGRVDVVGASFAVLKLTIDGQTVDIATPRRERSFGVGTSRIYG